MEEDSDYYDSEDSFIDDSALDHEIQSAYNMKNVHTKRSGFFVSAGELEVNASKSAPLLQTQLDDDGVGMDVDDDAAESSYAKEPTMTSLAAIDALKTTISKKMITFHRGQYPDDIRSDIMDAYGVCKKKNDVRWFVDQLTDLLKHTNLSRDEIRKYLRDGLKSDTFSIAERKKKFSIKSKKAIAAIEDLMALKAADCVTRVKDQFMGIQVSNIREADSLLSSGCSLSDEQSVIVASRLQVYSNLWAALWEDGELIDALHKYQDACKIFASAEAESRISIEANKKVVSSNEAETTDPISKEPEARSEDPPMSLGQQNLPPVLVSHSVEGKIEVKN